MIKKIIFLFYIIVIFISFTTTGFSKKVENIFGTSKKSIFSLKGDIYYLPNTTYNLPDFSRLKPIGKIFTNILNIPPRNFSEGFPGVSKRFEWFAIDYKGKFYVSKDRNIEFSLLSDDGSKLFIDGKCIIDNGGIHPPRKLKGKIFLKKGFHSIEVQYFQGPRYKVALVLSYVKEGKEVPFNMKDFIPLQIDETKCKINLKIGDKILFDFNKYNLKNSAKEVLSQILNELTHLNYKKIIIEGHTDSIGTNEYNLKLSKNRANSVADFFIKKGINRNKILTKGYGESKPIASNKTESGRAKNRRVEIKILKNCEEKNQSDMDSNKITLLKIGENPLSFANKEIVLEGYAKGWAARDMEQKARALFQKLPFAKDNTGLSRNWGSFTDGTAVILFPISPKKWGKYRIKAQIKITNNKKWYVKVIEMKKIDKEE